ncbi:hypothetical protein D3C73_719170 [compost metagenome]
MPCAICRLASSRGNRSATIGSRSVHICSCNTIRCRRRSGTPRLPGRRSSVSPAPSSWRGCGSCWSWHRRVAITANSSSDCGKRSARSSSSWPGSPPSAMSWSPPWRGSAPSGRRRAMPWSRPAPWPASSSIATCSRTGLPARSAAPRSIPIARASPRWLAYWRSWPSASVSWISTGSDSIISTSRGRAKGSNWPASWPPASSISPSWRRDPNS